jgi:hypothetical protein
MTGRIRAREGFSHVIARAKLTRRQVADAAHVNVRTIDALANPSAAGRSGFAREVTAWKIADGLARLTGQTAEIAFESLFERVEETEPGQLAAAPQPA